MRELQLSMFKASYLLAAFALFGVILVSVTHHFTEDAIAEAKQQAKIRTFEQVIKLANYTNDVIAEQHTLSANDSPFDAEATVYFARNNQRLSAVVLNVTTFAGYNGRINLLVSVQLSDDENTAKVLGVRVLEHKETPGLGDKIDIAKSDWILNFTGKTLENSAWDVKKHQGSFDAFTGATITPRAVIHAVRDSLMSSEKMRDVWRAMPARSSRSTTQENQE